MLTDAEKNIQDAANDSHVLLLTKTTLASVYKNDVLMLLSVIEQLRRRNHAMLLQVDKWRIRCRDSWEESDGNFTSAFRMMQEIDRLKSLQPRGHPKSCIVSDDTHMGGTGHCAWCEDIAKIQEEDIGNARRLTG